MPTSTVLSRGSFVSRRTRAFLSIAVVLLALTEGTSGQDVQTVGVPSIGALGVQRTSADIMARQAVAPPSQSGNWRMLLERDSPDRSKLPQNPQSAPVARTPVRETAAPEPAPTAPQTLSTSFTGATLADTGSFPPDTMGAVGPTQFFVHLNGRIRTFNKTTGVADGVLNAEPDIFFESVMTTPPMDGLNFTRDPQVRYDRLTKRWFLIIIDVPSTSPDSIGDLPNRVLMAVSDAASNGVITGSTVWTYFYIQQDTLGGIPSTGEFLDYPSLGVDNSALYIGGNMMEEGFFSSAMAIVVRKTSVLGGGPIVATPFRGIVPTFLADGPFSPRGVDNYDPAATEGYFIGVSNASFGRLNMRRIGDPGGTPTISADIPITVSTTTYPEPVPHLGNTAGSTGLLDALDDRLFAAHIRNGRLWTAHNIEVNASGVASTSGNRNGTRWYELNVPVGSGTPTVVQSGTTFDPSATDPRFYWIPSVVVSGQGHAAFGFSSAGNADRINAATNGRLRTDTLGTTGAVELYTASSTAYNPAGDPGGFRRWGDYSFVSVDPDDDMTLWTIQEFCNATDSYGVRVVKLLAPPPATPATATPSTVLPGVSSQNITITGTSVTGSEFFDPGVGFAKRIAATVTGGVTVNSITYTDPTHVTIDVSTVGATGGTKDVSITNPDGQVRQGAAVFTVGVPSTFTDDPLVAGTTAIKQVHVNELRARIDAVRATYTLAPYTYSEAVSAGTVIKASHILEMRAAINAAYAQALLPLPTYTTTPAVGVPVTTADIQDLRSAVLNIE